MSDAFIREAKLSDAATIADFNIRMAFETEHLRLDPPTVNNGVLAALSDPNKGRYFVAEIDNKVAAQLLITHEWSDWRNGDIWWIQSVYVHPDHRRRGLFRQLYARIREMARTEKAAALRLYVEKENENAQRTYESLGMEFTHYYVMEQLV